MAETIHISIPDFIVADPFSKSDIQDIENLLKSIASGLGSIYAETKTIRTTTNSSKLIASSIQQITDTNLQSFTRLRRGFGFYPKETFDLLNILMDSFITMVQDANSAGRALPNYSTIEREAKRCNNFINTKKNELCLLPSTAGIQSAQTAIDNNCKKIIKELAKIGTTSIKTQAEVIRDNIKKAKESTEQLNSQVTGMNAIDGNTKNAIDKWSNDSNTAISTVESTCSGIVFSGLPMPENLVRPLFDLSNKAPKIVDNIESVKDVDTSKIDEMVDHFNNIKALTSKYAPQSTEISAICAEIENYCNEFLTNLENANNRIAALWGQMKTGIETEARSILRVLEEIKNDLPRLKNAIENNDQNMADLWENDNLQRLRKVENHLKQIVLIYLRKTPPYNLSYPLDVQTDLFIAAVKNIPWPKKVPPTLLLTALNDIKSNIQNASQHDILLDLDPIFRQVINVYTEIVSELNKMTMIPPPPLPDYDAKFVDPNTLSPKHVIQVGEAWKILASIKPTPYHFKDDTSNYIKLLDGANVILDSTKPNSISFVYQPTLRYVEITGTIPTTYLDGTPLKGGGIYVTFEGQFKIDPPHPNVSTAQITKVKLFIIDNTPPIGPPPPPPPQIDPELNKLIEGMNAGLNTDIAKQTDMVYRLSRYWSYLIDIQKEPRFSRSDHFNQILPKIIELSKSLIDLTDLEQKYHYKFRKLQINPLEKIFNQFKSKNDLHTQVEKLNAEVIKKYLGKSSKSGEKGMQEDKKYDGFRRHILGMTQSARRWDDLLDTLKRKLGEFNLLSGIDKAYVKKVLKEVDDLKSHGDPQKAIGDCVDSLGTYLEKYRELIELEKNIGGLIKDLKNLEKTKYIGWLTDKSGAKNILLQELNLVEDKTGIHVKP